MVELGAWRVRAAWHAAVPVPIAPVQPLHQPDLWLHPPPAQLQTAGIRHCCVQFLRAMVTLYSPMQPAAQCQLSMGCGAGKRAFHAWRQRQQAQLCPPCCRRPSTLTCPGWSSGNWLCNSPTNHIQNPAETPGWRLACTCPAPTAAPVQHPQCHPNAHSTCMGMRLAVVAASAPP